MAKYRLTMVVSVVLFLAGCAASPLSLDKNASEGIASIDQLIVIPQNNLDITVPAGNPGNSGILGALIVGAVDAARRSSAEKKAAPIISKLQDYDFRAVMLNSMQNEITDTDNLKYDVQTRLEIVDSESNRRILFDHSESSAVLFSSVNYRLESGNLIITATAEMYPKDKSLYQYRTDPSKKSPIDAGNTIYRKNFTFTKQAINAANIQASLSEGANNIAEQIISDLSHPI